MKKQKLAKINLSDFQKKQVIISIGEAVEIKGGTGASGDPWG